MAKLTPKQKVFVAEYLKDLNATQAAIRAGYSERTAQEQSSRLLSNVIVKAAVEEAMQRREKRTEITQDYVLGGIKNLTERCIQEKDGKPIEPTAAFRGYELLGKHLKLFTDKSEITLENLKELTDEQLSTLAARLAGSASTSAASGTK